MAADARRSIPPSPLLETSNENDTLSTSRATGLKSRDLVEPDRKYVDPETAGLHDASEHGRRKACKRNLLPLWWAEVLSILFSFSCLAANVGVLAHLDNKPYESWQISRIDFTPNAIISTIATFTKASLLLTIAEVIVQLKWLYFQARVQRVSDLQAFDDASRGPLGSMRLLWRINLHSSIASLSAVVTILALAAEPFTQQVLRYPTKQITATNTSAVLSTTSALQSSDMNSAQDNTVVSSSTYLQQLNVAVNSGILNRASDVAYNCPSGSCTWPRYSSLALCSSCQDIALHVDVSCSNDNRTDPDYRMCRYSIGSELVGLQTGTDLPLAAWNLWKKSNGSVYEPVTLMNITRDFTNALEVPGMSTWIDVVRFNESYNSNSPNAPDDILPTALRCSFDWCAHYYGSTRVVDGKLFDLPSFSVPLAIDNGRSIAFVPDNTSRSLADLRHFSKTDEIYQINWDLSGDFQDLLVSELEATAFSNTIGSDAIGQLPLTRNPEYQGLLMDRAGQGKGYALYYANDGDFPGSLDNVAMSVTNQIRSSAGSRNMTGTARYPVVYIHVIWPWLIYPAALSVSAAILLGLTMWLSHGRQRMVWKSSSLVLLFHGLPDGEADGRLLDIAAMEREADGMWATFSKDDDGIVKLKML